ncbi:MAG: LptE family protein, partial [Candidatus Eisenbacteria sp.]|nr:LptE family protein [Candidatus Eisenbacteria bacterium]
VPRVLPVTVLLAAALLLGAGLVLVGGAGCSHYSFSSAVKTHISTIAVPVLLNETLEYAAEQGVTDAIITEFTEDNALRVVGEEEADSILRGAVVVYERPVISYDASGNPTQYKVRVVARLSYEDLTKNEIVWEEDVEGWSVYSEAGEGGDLTTEEEAREYAFEKLAQDVLSKTVQGW